MMTTLQPYIVRPGDYLTKLAHQRGFSAAAVWELPENTKIREQRSNFDLLQPGDIIHIPIEQPRPRLELNLGEVNRYVAAIPKKPIYIKLQIGNQILVKEPFEIIGVGPNPVRGETDEKGFLSARVAVHVREIEVRLLRRNKILRVFIGNMDPPAEDSGIQKRLTHLGYYQPNYVGAENHDAKDPGQLRTALAAFQAANRLPTTGRPDKRTLRALVKANGS